MQLYLDPSRHQVLEMTVEEALTMIEKLTRSVQHSMRYNLHSFGAPVVIQRNEIQSAGALSIVVNATP